MPLHIKHDGLVDIAIGKSRKQITWKNEQWNWSKLVEKLSVTHRTAETYGEYIAAKRDRQDEIKDIGGFVGGYLSGGRRKAGSVMHRQLVTLDIDFANAAVWDDFTMLYGCAAALYSTHKHTPEKPRYRLVLPLDREVGADEYMSISRRLAGSLGINLFDHTTFQPERLMYWPSTAKDGKYEFEAQDGVWLIADEILNSYHDWRDSSEWPISDREVAVIKKGIQKQGDPLEKPGIVGAFCRTYTIAEAIAAFLGDVYEACDVDDRYTYKEGSTAAGVIVYEDKYAFSHHGTDPISGKLCNAFDLVRLHKFGLKDEDVKEGTPINRYPSFVKMEEFARKDKSVTRLLGLEKFEKAKKDFEIVPEDETEDETEEKDKTLWIDALEADKKGNYLSTRNNFKLILENDPALKGAFAFDEFSKRKIVLRDLPWRVVDENSQWIQDEDEANLRIYMADEPYSLSHNGNLKDVFDSIIIGKSVHPIKEYLKGLKWDGEERLETLFIDYMGADDSIYTREVTRKAIVAAVARVFHPGVQFDYVLTLIGEEGKRKSSIFRKLAKKWFSDTFSFEMLKRGKEAFEQLQGYWIIEIAELAGLRKADIEPVKHFLTKRDDVYRIPHKAYTSQFKRQCVFFGTTNNWDFLQSNNGNRRFWPMPILIKPAKKSVAIDLTDEEIDQIWAEAVALYKAKERLYLTDEVEEMAKEMQRKHTEADERFGAIEKYLNTLLPDTWEDMSTYDRRSFMQDDELTAKGTKARTQVCVAEIWCEVLGGHIKDMTSYNTKSLHAIMQNMTGWKLGGQRRFGVYGVQKAYLKEEIRQRKTGVSSLSSLNL